MTTARKIKLVVLLVLTVILLIVVFQNWKADTFQILFWERNVSPSLLIIIAFVLGFVGGLFACGYFVRRKAKRDEEKEQAPLDVE
jgi:uncharacterized integral membrane protein